MDYLLGIVLRQIAPHYFIHNIKIQKINDLMLNLDGLGGRTFFKKLFLHENLGCGSQISSLFFNHKELVSSHWLLIIWKVRAESAPPSCTQDAHTSTIGVNIKAGFTRTTIKKWFLDWFYNTECKKYHSEWVSHFFLHHLDFFFFSFFSSSRGRWCSFTLIFVYKGMDVTFSTSYLKTGN